MAVNFVLFIISAFSVFDVVREIRFNGERAEMYKFLWSDVIGRTAMFMTPWSPFTELPKDLAKAIISLDYENQVTKLEREIDSRFSVV